jgi:hypothetical protein
MSDKSKTQMVKDFLANKEIDKAIKLAGSWRWNKSDKEGQKIIMAREILIHKKFYEGLYKLKGVSVDDVYNEGVQSLLNHKQFA